MKAIILAAGRGSRLRPLTDKIPKSLVRINGETLIERHLKNLSRSFFEEVVINLSYLGDLIEDYVGDGSKFGISVKYSREGVEPLETLGGILQAIPMMGEIEKFAVINADIWTNYPFKKLHCIDHDAHVVLTRKPRDVPVGDFDLNGDLAIENESNPFVFAGISKYSTSVFEGFPTQRKSLGPLLKKWSKTKNLTGELYEGEWFDIGNVDRLKRATSETLLPR